MADHYFGNNDTVNEFLQYLIAEVIIFANPPHFPVGMYNATDHCVTFFRFIVQLIRDYGEEPDDADQWYGTDDINEPAFGHTFTVEAKVWKGSVMITDYLIDGESIKAYIQFGAQETSDAESG